MRLCETHTSDWQSPPWQTARRDLWLPRLRGTGPLSSGHRRPQGRLGLLDRSRSDSDDVRLSDRVRREGSPVDCSFRFGSAGTPGTPVENFSSRSGLEGLLFRRSGGRPGRRVPRPLDRASMGKSRGWSSRAMCPSTSDRGSATPKSA